MTIDSAAPGTHEVSMEDIGKELERRRRIYTKLFELTSPNAKGDRAYLLDHPCEIFAGAMKQLRVELGLRERDVATPFGKVRLTEIRTTEDVWRELFCYQCDLYDKMRIAGWIRCEVFIRPSQDSWLYLIRLIANPEEINRAVESHPVELPNKLVPIGVVELQSAHKCLMGVSLEHRGERFVGNPEEVLGRHFGTEYDATNTIDLLIDAGLAEWRNSESIGVTTERLFLYEPKVQKAPSTIEAVSDPIETLRARRQELVLAIKTKDAAEADARREADSLNARLREINAHLESLVGECTRINGEIEQIDIALRELDEIARLEKELAARKAKVLSQHSSS